MDLSGLEGLMEAIPQGTSSALPVATPAGTTASPGFRLNIPGLAMGRQSGQFVQASPLNITGLQPLPSAVTRPEPVQKSPEEIRQLIRQAFDTPLPIQFDNQTMDKWEVPNLICNTCQTVLPPMLHLLYRAMIRGEITDPGQRVKLVNVLGLSTDVQNSLLYPDRADQSAKVKLLSVYGLPPSEMDNLIPGVISSPFALKIVRKLFGIDQICCNGQIMFPLRMVLGEAIDPGFMERLHVQIRIISGHFNNKPIGPTFDSVTSNRSPSVIPGIYMDTNPDNDPFTFLRQVSFYSLKQTPTNDPANWIRTNL